MQFFDAIETEALLPMRDCVDAMEDAMRAISAGAVSLPPRQFIETGYEDTALGVMPCVSVAERAAVTKVLSLKPSNGARDLPSIQGFVALMDLESGALLALMDGAKLTALRTAAASGLATRVLARKDASTCGIFGTGVQASSHLRAMQAVREIREVRVWGRSYAKAQAFAETESEACGIEVRACERPEPVANCDLLCTVTGSDTPVLRGDWVAPGTHVNLVGAHSAQSRESDTALIKKSLLFADVMAALEHEGGDFRLPIEEGAINTADIRGELGAVLSGVIAGRERDADITVYNSLGTAAQDLFAALALYRNWASKHSLSAST